LHQLRDAEPRLAQVIDLAGVIDTKFREASALSRGADHRPI
jgi:hypothetical protein